MSTIPVPPPGYVVDAVPDFLKPTARTATTTIVPNDPNYAAEVSIVAPHTIKYFGADQVTQPTTTHEVTHIFDNSRSVGTLADDLFSRLKGKTTDSYDYGGMDGLLEAQKAHKTIADFGPEQRAEMVKDWQQMSQHAIKTGDSKLLDQVNEAYGPLIRQFAALPARGDSSGINTTPADPGLPPAAQTGILAPDKLLGGDVRIVPPAGYVLDRK